MALETCVLCRKIKTIYTYSQFVFNGYICVDCKDALIGDKIKGSLEICKSCGHEGTPWVYSNFLNGRICLDCYHRANAKLILDNHKKWLEEQIAYHDAKYKENMLGSNHHKTKMLAYERALNNLNRSNDANTSTETKG